MKTRYIVLIASVIGGIALYKRFGNGAKSPEKPNDVSDELVKLTKDMVNAIAQKMYDIYTEYHEDDNNDANWSKWKNEDKKKEFEGLISVLKESGWMLKIDGNKGVAVKIDDKKKEDTPTRGTQRKYIPQNEANGIAFAVKKKRADMARTRYTKEGYNRALGEVNALLQKLIDGGYQYKKGDAVIIES